MVRIYILITGLFFFCASSGSAQETEFFKKEKKNERFETGIPIFSPFIMPAYYPQTGFNITGGGLLSFKTKRNNPYLKHSTLPVIIGVNTKGAYFATLSLKSYWFDSNMRFDLDAEYRNIDDNYWGIGMERGFNVEKGQQTTGYHNEGYYFSPTLSYRIFRKFYVGIKADFRNTKATDISDLMLEDQHIQVFGTEIFSSGLGGLIAYDSRDIRHYASEGILLKLEGLFYNKGIGSDYNYQVVEFDYRQYLSIIREGSVLAWQLKTRLGFADIPWVEMSTPGSVNDLRGYYLGQFRDNSMLLVLIEYRHSFFNGKTMNFSRHGMVFWVGGGTVYSSLENIESGIFNLGVGYRYELQPGMNLRIDMGFGTESMAVYLSFTEAF